MHPSFKSWLKIMPQLISIFLILAMLITILPLYGNINTKSSSHNASPLFTTNHPNPGNNDWSQWLNGPYKNAVINNTSPMVENLSWNITLPTGNATNFHETGLLNMPEMIDYNHSIIVGGYNTSYLYSINDTTGNVNWIFEAGPGYTFNVSSVVAENTIMAVANNIQTRNAVVYGINATTGKNMSFTSVYAEVGNPNFVAGSPILAKSTDGYYGFINAWIYSTGESALSFNITSSGVSNVATSNAYSYPVYGGMSNDGTTFNLYETRTTASANKKYEVQYVFKSNGASPTRYLAKNTGTVYSWSSPVIINYSGKEQGFFTYAGYGGGGNTPANWFIDYFSPVTNVNGGTYTKQTNLFQDNPAGASGYPTQNLIYTTPLYYNGEFFIAVNKANLGAGTTNGNTYILNYSYSQITSGGPAAGAPQNSLSFGPTGTNNYIYANPIISNGIIYVGAGDSIYAINATNFKKLWSYNTGAPIYASPIISHGNLYVYNSAGNLLCFNTPRLNGNITYKINGQSTPSHTVPSGGNLTLFVNTSWYNSASLQNVPTYQTEVVFDSLGFGSFSNSNTITTSYTTSLNPATATWHAPIVYQNTSFLIKIEISTGNNLSYFYPHVYYELFYVSPAKSLSVTAIARPSTINLGTSNTSQIEITINPKPTSWSLNMSIIYGNKEGHLNKTIFNSLTSSSWNVTYFETARLSSAQTVQIRAIVSSSGYLPSYSNITLNIMPGNMALNLSATPGILYTGWNATLAMKVTNQSAPLPGMNVTMYSNKYGRFNNSKEIISGYTNSNGIFKAYLLANPVTSTQNDTIYCVVQGYNYTNATIEKTILIQPDELNVSVEYNSTYVRPGETISGYVKTMYENAPTSATLNPAYSDGKLTITKTTNSNGIAYFTFKANSNIYNATAVSFTINASYNGIIGYNYSTIMIIPNNTYPSQALMGNIKIQYPVLNYSTETSTTINVTFYNASGKVSDVNARIYLSNKSLGEFRYNNKEWTNGSAIKVLNSYINFTFTGNGSQNIGMEYFMLVLNKSGYINNTISGNITILPAMVNVEINTLTLNESYGENFSLKGIVHNYYAKGNYARFTYINITSAQGLKWRNATTSNGTFYIPVTIITPRNITYLVHANLTVKSNYSYAYKLSVIINILPAIYKLNLYGMPDVMPLHSSVTFNAIIYSPVNNFQPYANYTITPKPNLGSISETVNKNNLSVTFIANLPGIETIGIAAHTSNGTTLYRNSTITIYNASATYFTVNVTATPNVISTKALANSTIITKVEYYNGTPAQAFVQLKISNSTVGHFTNQNGYTANGIFKSTLVITQPSTKVQVYAIANISKTAVSNATTIFFTNGSSKALSVSISPLNLTLMGGHEGKITINVSSNNEPVRNATIKVENMNNSIGYVVYNNETSMNGSALLIYYSNITTETSIDALMITVSKGGYYNYTGICSIAVMPATKGINYLSLSYTYINKETSSGGEINLTIEVKDAVTNVPMANANITIILEYPNGTKAELKNGTSNAYGYYNQTINVPKVKSNQTMYAIIKASKAGYANQVYKEYTINVVIPGNVKASVPSTSNTITEGSMWWIVIVLAVILGILSMMYANARIGKVPKAEVSEPIIRSEIKEVHNKPRIISETTAPLPKVIQEIKAPEIRAEKEKDEEFDEWVYQQPTMMELEGEIAVVSSTREGIEGEEINEDAYAKMMVSWEKVEEEPSVYEQPGESSGYIESKPIWASESGMGISIEAQIEEPKENAIELPEKEMGIEVRKEEPKEIATIESGEGKAIKEVEKPEALKEVSKEETKEPKAEKTEGEEKPKERKGKGTSQSKQKTHKNKQKRKK